ncbi:MAG TPA: hypothetical protein VK528_08825 [Flavobacterium sp.]|nr:hypothetical protein [Flavobacterium sp.]
MKKLMMFVAVLGLSTAASFAQEAPAKTVKKHKTEKVKADGKTEAKTETKTKEVKVETAKAAPVKAAPAKK